MHLQIPPEAIRVIFTLILDPLKAAQAAAPAFFNPTSHLRLSHPTSPTSSSQSEPRIT